MSWLVIFGVSVRRRATLTNEVRGYDVVEI